MCLVLPHASFSLLAWTHYLCDSVIQLWVQPYKHFQITVGATSPNVSFVVLVTLLSWVEGRYLAPSLRAQIPDVEVMKNWGPGWNQSPNKGNADKYASRKRNAPKTNNINILSPAIMLENQNTFIEQFLLTQYVFLSKWTAIRNFLSLCMTLPLIDLLSCDTL